MGRREVKNGNDQEPTHCSANPDCHFDLLRAAPFPIVSANRTFCCYS